MTGAHIIVAAITALSPLLAQSPIQLYGLGAPQSSEDVSSDGAGDIRSLPLTAGGAYPASIASWHNLRSTQLRATMASQMSMTPAADPRFSSGLRSVHFLVHLDNRSALGFGLTPLTRAELLLHDETGSYILASDTLLYTQARSISGGVSSLRAGYSRKLSGSISLGIALDILFGSILQSDTLQFRSIGSQEDILAWLTSGGSFLGSERNTSFLGRNVELNLTTGAIPSGRSQLGIRVNVPLSLTARTTTRYANTAPFRENRDNDLQLPASMNIGYAINLGQHQRLLAEWSQQQWQDSDANDILFDRHFEKVTGWAASWTAKPASLTSPSPGRMFYRVGFNNKTYYLSDLKNNPLSEVVFSLGIGVRSLRSNYKVDLALKIGQRDGLLDLGDEKFGRLSIGISTGELWFVRQMKNWN